MTTMLYKRIVQAVKGLRLRSGCPKTNGIGRSHIAPEMNPSESFLEQEEEEDSKWSNLPPELLLDIIQRVEADQIDWPSRRDVIVCASVCKSWRECTMETVQTPEHSGSITFPISLMQPAPRGTPIQCFIKRDRATSTYRLYLGLTPAMSSRTSKLLLAAKRSKRATRTDFLISLSGHDFSSKSNKLVGKLKSNFLGTKFAICESQQVSSSSKKKKKLQPARVSMSKVGNISYELNIIQSRGPRRMKCAFDKIPMSAIKEGGIAPTPTKFQCPDTGSELEEPLVLRNKSPRWHEQLQCWCLNFKGRVTVASVKNFQLVASPEPYQDISDEEQDRVILQFGKMGKDFFSMDYCYPLSAYQAFAICLSSFDTKPVCE
ncbi:tubby-like F-box protein 6 [Impatiens glandulifera]|uniref:tubby-like F-box protein 6 n=1 Tax=Impatiens glandulifera TaxID=253017 RepID=UPI001FB0BD0A|nr:tubby-like F-box protein 6 [Impatiens glandulifera]